MLKITTKERPGSVTFVLEGRLCGPWAAEAELAWSRLVASLHEEEILLDLAGVTFIDRDGEALLAAIVGRGTKVRASGVMISHLIEEVQQRGPRGR
jgi:anti-anti-sigma regulatory factor